MKNNGKKDPRISITILTGLICILLFGFILETTQNQMVIRDIQSEMNRNMEYILDTYQTSSNYSPNVSGSFMDLRREELEFLRYLSVQDPGFSVSDSYLAEVNEELNLADVMIADREGNIIASASGEKNPLTGTRFAPLRESFETGVVGMVSMISDKEAWNLMQNLDGPDTFSYNYYSMFILYSLPMNEEYEFVLMEYGIQTRDFENTVNSWWEVLKNITVGVHGFAFAWKEGTWELLYYPDESLRFENVSVLNMDMEQAGAGGFGWNTIQDRRMYVYTKYYEPEQVYIACAVPEEELLSFTRVSILVLWTVFALLTADVIYYTILLLRRKKGAPGREPQGAEVDGGTSSRPVRLFMFSLLQAVILFLLAFYLQTLYSMSAWADESVRQLDRIESRLEDNDITARQYAKMIEESKYCQMNLLVLYMEKYPDRVTDLFLNDMSGILALTDLTVFDNQGKIKTVTSDEYYRRLNLSEMTAELGALTGNAATVEKTENIYTWMVQGGIPLVTPMYSSNGRLEGYVYARYYSDQANTVLKSLAPSRTMDLVEPGEGGFLFSVEADTAKFTYYPDGSLTGRNALEYGLQESRLRDNVHDFVTINRERYYSASRLHNSDLIYYSISTKDLFRQRFSASLLTAAVTLGFLLLIGLPVFTSAEGGEKEDEEEYPEEKPGRIISPEYRVYSVLGYYAAGFAALFALYNIFRGKIAFSSVFNYVMEGNWEHGLNVFALTAALIYLSEGGFLLFIGRRFINALARCLPARGGTILRMLSSLAAYIGIFFLCYVCLVCFGMNPTALMASAGIVSVVLGIGANSLVGDILAGIFLLTEGDIQVGDVVKIGDFRGYVQEMGIRRTRLYDLDNEDVRILPNKAIQDVVNMSIHASLVYNRFSIGYEEDLERVEALLREELKNMYGKVPYLLAAPEYLGVKDLGDSGVILICSARCHEAFRYRVEREINRRVYLMFKKNGIEIPYPQMQIRE